MSATNWKQIRAQLAATSPPPPPPADAFWATFRARAALVNQEAPVAAPRSTWWAWLAAPATLAAVLVALSVNLAPADATPTGNVITALDVQGEHSSVVVIQDRESQGTIVMVTDMTPPPAKEESR